MQVASTTHLGVLRPLVAAIGIALLTITSPSRAAPAVGHWTLIDLGTPGGTESVGVAVNKLGQVVGNSYLGGSSQGLPFLYSNGVMTNLGTLGGTFGGASGINDLGQVTGYARTSSSVQHAFLYSGGVMTDLGTLGGTYSTGAGINHAGQAIGTSTLSGDYDYHAYLYSNGAMRDLGTLGGTHSYGYGLNASGMVTGTSDTIGGWHAFSYHNGVMTDLGTLGGSNSYGYAINDSGVVAGMSNMRGDSASHAALFSGGNVLDLGALGGSLSIARGINNAGVVVGSATTAADVSVAFLYANGRMSDINSFNGVAGSGLTLENATGLNDVGQITGAARNAAGEGRAYLLTLDTTVWETASGGAWDNGASWTQGIAPNHNTHAIIDPTRSLTVTGPTGRAEVKRLSIGGDASGGGGIATLRLDGGTISAVGDDASGHIGWQGVWVGKNGVLTGDGVISVDSALSGAVFNYGTVVADNLRIQGSAPSYGQLLNHGLIVGSATGPARITSNYLINEATGRIQVLAGERLNIHAAMANTGRIEVLGGQFSHVGGDALQNSSSGGAVGRIVAQNALLSFNSGLNAGGGQLSFTAGNSNVFGHVSASRSLNDSRGGQIIVTGNSQVAFNDTVEVQEGSELRVSTGSTAVFLGRVTQQAGALFTGGGTKFFEGGLSIGGAAPAAGRDAGDVGFGADNVFFADIGAGAAGSGFDAYAVAGNLSFGGSLRLASWHGFVGQAGQRFDLFDWGSASGHFDSIDSSAFALADGTWLDTSRLGIDGSISIQAVPEPQTWLLMLSGVALLCGGRRRS